jgi:hypothetical protein
MEVVGSKFRIRSAFSSSVERDLSTRFLAFINQTQITISNFIRDKKIIK